MIPVTCHYSRNLQLSRSCCKTLIFILQNSDRAVNHPNQCFICNLITRPCYVLHPEMISVLSRSGDGGVSLVQHGHGPER